MMTTKKALLAGVVFIALLGMQTYAFVSSRNVQNEKIATLESEIQSLRETNASQATQITADLGVITNRMGVTNQELQDARRVAEQFRQEQAKAAARVNTELEQHTQAVDTLRVEATTKIAEVQEQATTQIGAVTGDVQTVKVDLDNTKSDLAASRREMTDMRDALGREIARNSSDVAELRRRGEKDYFEFDVPKAKTMQRIADIQMQLRKADTKKQRYDVTLLVDDKKMEKNGIPINEPITFLAGRDRIRYEFVVFAVDKDRIRGYVSAPKDKVLSAEGPAFRQ
jgi:hypothetical protein